MTKIQKIKKNKYINIVILICLLYLTACNFNNEKYETDTNEIIIFKDEKLKEKLLENGVDTNQNKEISFDEASSYEGILDLSGYGINNVDGIQYFTKVRVVNLSNNNLKNLKLISELKEITSLDLSFNNIEDISGIENCSNLMMLDLSSNKISNADVISKLTNLEFLAISTNEINNIDEIGNCTKLQYLLIDNNNISDISALKDLPISELWVNDTSIVKIPEELLLKLRKVNISNTGISESDIRDFTEIIK